MVALAVALLLPSSVAAHEATRLIIAWNAGALLYLVLAGMMVSSSTVAKMQERACAQDEGQNTILLLVILAAITCLAAIIVELAVVKDMKGAAKYAHIALALLTIFSSWAFTHTMFALHYAHDFYAERSKGKPGGLAFPSDHDKQGNDTQPDYFDFLYFSFVIGTSGQTADVSLTSQAMRRTGLVHCVLAFIFNTTVLALTINIAASLI
jgi:uncharacterized membrane protein